jgi:tetratricopeptide (TPR) repeat protein
VRAYRSGGPAGPGDVVPAVSALALWPRREVARAAVSAQSTFAVSDLIAAAVLHTELANAVADRAPDDAGFHIKTASDLLMAARHQDAARADIVGRQWYAFVAGLYEALQRVQDAARFVHDGLQQLPRAAELYVARATVIEANVRRVVPDLRRDVPLESRTRLRLEDAFKAVVSNCQQALDRDHTLPAAYLHIGWARLMMHDQRAAEALDRAVEYADGDELRYLAHLFLGSAHEQAHRLEDARQEYGRAVASGRYQSAYVALSRVEDALGHADRARELAMTAARAVALGDDPWWDFRIGFDRAALHRLRAEAQR